MKPHQGRKSILCRKIPGLFVFYKEGPSSIRWRSACRWAVKKLVVKSENRAPSSSYSLRPMQKTTQPGDHSKEAKISAILLSKSDPAPKLLRHDRAVHHTVRDRPYQFQSILNGFKGTNPAAVVPFSIVTPPPITLFRIKNYEVDTAVDV